MSHLFSHPLLAVACVQVNARFSQRLAWAPSALRTARLACAVAPRRGGRTILAAISAVMLASVGLAFPPSPHYTLFGLVRDQVGNVLSVQGAEIVLVRDNKEIGRGPVYADVRGDLNYELDIRIDQGRATTRSYTSKAVPAQGVFSLYVEMNGTKFFPIEVAGTLRAGNGAERVRLDLNLGGDADRDGLPDAWEEWQLYQSGRRAGAQGWDLSLIDRDGDLDGDGVSNFLEYVAGTFAGDATERFELRLVGKTTTAVQLEFFAITGKIYSVEQSSDLRTWATVAFALMPGATAGTLHRATAVGPQVVHVALSGQARFYRLVAR
jgi:hypothetical protein